MAATGKGPTGSTRAGAPDAGSRWRPARTRRQSDSHIRKLEEELDRIRSTRQADHRAMGEVQRLLRSAQDATDARSIRPWRRRAFARDAADARIRDAESRLSHLDRVSHPDEDHDVAARKRPGAWCHRKSAHIAVLQADLNRIEARHRLDPADLELAHKARVCLEAARDAVERHSFWAWWTGSDVARVEANIHEAELLLLRLVPNDELRWYGAEVITRGRHHLGPQDPRLTSLETHLQQNANVLSPEFKGLAVAVMSAANYVEETEVARVRSFRNILLATFLVTTAITVLFILSGYLMPAGLPPKLCFDPPSQTTGVVAMVCPIGSTASGSAVLLVALCGVTGATLAGAASIRHIQGTAMPYMVPVCLLMLRLPIGALSAILGLILIRGGFLPGLSALDNSAQIVAWAVAFGIGQEGLTRMIDKQGGAVLKNVHGSYRKFDTDPAGPPVAPPLPPLQRDVDPPSAG
ncbi:hypothetical protein [Actinacidiphila paucisporea]|uniref:Uncharacterized protein n=1 Tax=Actinacidiphila paucisporea TaxID=310782 RepID=A0A1M7NR22_9ACTN|nr:hypothetical protein [Actinacidiphila paucisporea]SHN05894.1 hypothetical protein SAMN05216499_11993 [Actinacidiphila paucisporea]